MLRKIAALHGFTVNGRVALEQQEHKKYRLTDETKVVNGVTVHRIEAIRSWGTTYEGKLGGFVESYKNLENDADSWSWIYNDAVVYGNAVVRDKGIVVDNSIVYGNAVVEGYVRNDAQIYDNAVVLHGGRVGGNAQVYGNATIKGLVGDYASVSGNAVVSHGASVLNHARVKDFARIEAARICGWSVVGGNVVVSGDAFIDGFTLGGRLRITRNLSGSSTVVIDTPEKLAAILKKQNAD